MGTQVQQAVDDRREIKGDSLITALKVFSAVDVVLIVLGAIIIFFAQPVSFLELDANLGIRTTWDPLWLEGLFFVFVVGAVVGTIGLLINARRLKRRNDHLRFNLIMVAIVSFIGLTVFVTKGMI